MALTSAEKEQADKWLQAQFPQCPVCRRITLEASTTGSLMDTQSTKPAPISERLVVVVCQNCGHTLLFQASKVLKS
jgi:predicted nucleic-acid-binding Zn-ribbon protein